MSRCFPFPPPGYEKKARADDADLLKKEKQREKKHKKEKKDKEKREGQKREKDRSDGKQRDKKDRKEKHRDKKKDKEDRDKDKEKASSSGEKRVAGKSDSYSGEKLNQKEKNQDKDKSCISDEKKQAMQFQGHNGEKPIRVNLPAEETGDSRFVQELDRRIRDEQERAGSQLVERFTGADEKKDEGMDRLVFEDTGTLAEGREKNKDKRVDNRKMDGRGIRDEAGFSGNAMVQNIAGMVQNRVEGMPRQMEKNIERRMEGKEKFKEKEGDDKRGDKRKDKDREKKSQAKDKEREKEKKKEEKVKERSEHKNTEQDKFKDSNKNYLIGTHNIKDSYLPKEGDKSVAVEGNLKKRKDLGTNGFLRDNDVRPNKVPRPTSHPLTENGRKLEPCQTPIPFTSDRQGAANNIKVDNREHKLNGIIEVQPPLSTSSTKPLPAITQADQIAEASMKPPHPDSKYLSQVHSVPKMDEWSDFDDQEWLFSSNDTSSKKPKLGYVGVSETPQVWAEALQIESADVCALPYVIPY
uniref:Putative Electron transport complex protein rnfC isoform 3 n=1 Tax=Davidia involucrata TaxID=16924 RepID=A0A5B6Z104_DAVIN